MKNTKKFKIITPVTKSEYNNDDQAFYIEGIANSGLEDLVGDIVTQEALQRIVDQAPMRNLHLDHKGGRENILGPIIDSELRQEGAWIKAMIINEHKDWIKSYMEQGVAFGLSISGMCDYKDGSYSEIVDWELTEISLTDTPCDPQTMGTVSMSKSFDNILLEIKNSKEQKKMADEEFITIDQATSLINDAFNERKEEFLETIRDELKSEYETQINELKERLETLETQIANANPQDPTDEDNGDEGDANDDNGDEGTDANLTEDEIKGLIDAKIKSIFGKVAKDVDFQYNQHKGNSGNDKKSFTARELAEMGVI